MTALRDISLPPSDADGAADELTRLRSREVDGSRPLLLGDGGALAVEWLGRVSYRPTWELQNELADRRRRREIGDRVLLLEHDPVYTIGRGGNEGNLLATPEQMAALGAELVRIDRGGDITFHGPGQLVAYPIVELADPLDLRRYVRALESAVIATAFRFGVRADRVDGFPARGWTAPGNWPQLASASGAGSPPTASPSTSAPTWPGLAR